MINFIEEFCGFHNFHMFYTDTDSLCIERKYWDVLNEAGDNFCQGKNDPKSRGIFNVLFLVPKIKYCLIIDKFGIIREQKNFLEFNISKRLLDRSQYSKILQGRKKSSVTQNLKKSFNSGLSYQRK